MIAPAHVGKLVRAAHNDYTPQFPVQLMHKDLRLILETATALDAVMPAAQAAYQINSAALASSPGEDFFVVMREMERLAHLNRSYEEVA